jgi:NitT/TauT family transport system substrate-binding protein
MCRLFADAAGRLIACAAAGLVALALLCPVPAAALDRVVVAQATDSLLFMCTYVAHGKGFFREEGIDFELEILPGGPQALAAVISGNADVYLGIPATAMKARLKGQDIKVYATLVSEVFSNIVIQGDVAARLGITSQTPAKERLAALRGLSLGVNTIGAAPEQVLRYSMRSVGLDPDRDATIGPAGDRAALLGAFQQKRIDGLVFSSPVSDIAIEKFGGVMLMNYAKGDDPSLQGFTMLGLISKSDWLASHPRQAVAMVRAVARAETLMKDHPDEAREAARQYFKAMDPHTFDIGFAAVAAATPMTPKSLVAASS